MQVAPVPQEGMAVDASDSSGLIEFTQDQPYVMERRDDKERIPFHSSQVCACCQDPPAPTAPLPPPRPHLLSHASPPASPYKRLAPPLMSPASVQYQAPLCKLPCHIPVFAQSESNKTLVKICPH